VVTGLLTGTNLSSGLKDEYTTNLNAAKGSSGRLTVTASAVLDKYTHEEWSVQQRYVYHWHKPKFLGADSEYSHPVDNPNITSINGSGNSIIIDYSFPKGSYVSVFIAAGFEIRYDLEVYNKSGNLLETKADQFWGNYFINTVYVWAQ